MSKGSAIRAVLVGCGAVARDLYGVPLRALERQGAVQIAALVDPVEQRTVTLGGTFHHARRFGSLEEATAGIACDVAIVTSPPHLHREHCLLALSRGLHVFCEKPLTTRADDAREIAAAGRKAGRLVGVGMVRRFFPVIAEVAAKIRRGDFGGHIEFSVHEGSVYDWPIASGAAFSRSTSGGGVLMDKGAHVLDALVALFGVPEIVTASDDASTGGVDSNCELHLRFPYAEGRVVLSWDSALANGFALRGSVLEVELDVAFPSVYRWRHPGGSWTAQESTVRWPAEAVPRTAPTFLPATYYDCFYAELVNLFRAVRHGEPIATDADEASLAVAAIEHAYVKANPLEQTWLPPHEQARAADLHWRNGA